MAADLLGILGIGSSLIGSVLGRSEARRRERAIRKAMQRLMEAQSQNRASAAAELGMARGTFLNDPRRAQMKSFYDQMLQNPDVIDPAMLSNMKNAAFDSAARDQEGGIAGLREQQQRAGIRTSPYALGMESALRSRSFGRNAALASSLDIEASRANRASRQAIGRDYGSYLSDDLSRELGFSRDIASLYADTRYESGALLGFM